MRSDLLLRLENTQFVLFFLYPDVSREEIEGDIEIRKHNY